MHHLSAFRLLFLLWYLHAQEQGIGRTERTVDQDERVIIMRRQVFKRKKKEKLSKAQSDQFFKAASRKLFAKQTPQCGRSEASKVGAKCPTLAGIISSNECGGA